MSLNAVIAWACVVVIHCIAAVHIPHLLNPVNIKIHMTKVINKCAQRIKSNVSEKNVCFTYHQYIFDLSKPV